MLHAVTDGPVCLRVRQWECIWHTPLVLAEKLLYSLCRGWGRSWTESGCTGPCIWRGWRRWSENSGPLCTDNVFVIDIDCLFPFSVLHLLSQSKRFRYLISSGTQLMFSDLEVKGEATEASASDRDTPTSAALRAPQSLAPSPHMPTR